MSLNNGGSLFTVSPPPNNEIENYFHDPSNSKEVPLDSEGRAWNRTHYRYDAKNLPKTSITANGTLPVSFIGGQVVLTGAVTSITLPTATQLKTQIETVWGAGTSTSYPWAWVVRTEFDNQTAGVVNLVMGSGDTALPGAGISFPANSLSEVEFQIMNSSPTATAIRVAIIANSSAAAGSNVTLTDGGTNETIIVNGTGPNLVIKDFAAGFLQDDNDYFDNVGASFQNRVAAGTLYLTLPDSGVRNAGDLQFLGATDFDTIQNAYNALVAAGGNTLLIPSYKTWDLSGGPLLISSAITVTGGGQDSQTNITINDNTAFRFNPTGAVQFFVFTGTLDVDEPAYAITTVAFGRVRIYRCQFRAVGISVTCGGYAIDDCTFLQYRNSNCIYINRGGIVPDQARIYDCTFRNYWFQIGSGFATLPNYGSAISGLPWVSGTTYSVGDVVINATNTGAYVLRTAGPGTSTDEPTGFDLTITGADQYTWQYMVPPYSQAIYCDPAGFNNNNNICTNTFVGCWFCVRGEWGSGCIVSDNQFDSVWGVIDNTDTAFGACNFSDLKFCNNTNDNCSQGISVLLTGTGPYSRLVVNGNTFADIKAPIWTQNSLAGSNPASGWIISHNTFRNYGYDAATYTPTGAIVLVSGDDATEPYFTDFVIDGNVLDSATGGADYGIALVGGGAGTSTYFIISNNMAINGGGVANIDVGTYPLAANARLVEDNVAP